MKRLIGGQPLYTKDQSVFSDAMIICAGNSGKCITYQIRTEHGNVGILKENEVEHWFDLSSSSDELLEPCIEMIANGYVLLVSDQHAKNITSIVPNDYYSLQLIDCKIGAFAVSTNNWKKFSELLCLSDLL
jgi:hypothetical protein